MKKLITLTFVLLFTAGIVFGQNNATVNQSGLSNNVNIEQVYQDGSSVLANEAIVEQVGDNNNVENLRQRGAGNTYNVYQQGRGNLVTQFPRQGDAGPSYNALIDIDQIGSNNIVHDADQTGYGNQITIMQNGNGNFADVEAQISPAGNQTIGNSIAITQTGDGNAVGTGTGTGIYQNGTNNVMTIVQENGSHAGTMSVQNLFGVPGQEGGQGLVQLGANNTLSINQLGMGSEVRFVLQDGIGNTATITQGLNNGGANTASITQIGNNNTATITQN